MSDAWVIPYDGKRRPHEREVVVVVPFKDGKVFLQLRDEKEGIVFPGYWGFFGGSMESGETPEEAAHRELTEELELSGQVLRPLGAHRLKLQKDLISHAFWFPIDNDISTIHEGMDGVFCTLDEISIAKRIYSKKMSRFYPVIPEPYIPFIVEKILRTSTR